MTVTTRNLPLKQARFVDEYLIDLNAIQAAIRAGYSPKTAYSQGQRLLKNVEIQSALANAGEERSQRTEIDQDWVLLQLKGIVEQSRIGVTVNLPAANKALELIGRHLQMFPAQSVPGSSPATPLYMAEVGYDINELLKDPEIREMVLELDAKMRALTGGEGIILERNVQ